MTAAIIMTVGGPAAFGRSHSGDCEIGGGVTETGTVGAAAIVGTGDQPRRGTGDTDGTAAAPPYEAATVVRGEY